jgi:hypothetical protein
LFKSNWDERYWNVHVAPAHNVLDWNKWKVLFVHLPNVLLTISFFVTYGSAQLYVATQAVALVGTTNIMCFPPPWSQYVNPPEDTQIKTYGDKHLSDRWYTDHWANYV